MPYKKTDKRIVIRSRVMGFCMGVKAVIKKVDLEVEADSERPLYTYGPLIHNRLVIEKLQKQGVKALEHPDQGSGGTLVIRAHGIHPAVRSDFENAGYRIVEGTCPRVLKSQQTVSEYSEKGWFIIIVGDRDHGEVRAIRGCAQNSAVVLTEEEAAQLEIPDKTLVIAQTTLSLTEYNNICDILSEKNKNIMIVESICPATQERQRSLDELLLQVDAVVVVGGKNSANTRRLYVKARNSGKPSWLIEEISDLPPEITKYRRIGITAGASTPDWIIDDIEKALLEM